MQPRPVMFSSREDVTTLGPYERVIQIERSDSGMVHGHKVYAMEHSIFDTLKEMECSRGFAEDGVGWVRMARLGAAPISRSRIFTLFGHGCGCRNSFYVMFLRVSVLDQFLRLAFPSRDWFRGRRCRWNVHWFK